MTEIVDLNSRRDKKPEKSALPGNHDGHLEYVVGPNGKVETRDDHEIYVAKKKKIEMDAKDRL